MAIQQGIRRGAVQRPQRPRELEDALNHYLYHPLSWKLARLLAYTPLTPNMVSVIGAGFVVSAAVVYAQPWWPVSALLGMGLHMFWHVVDGADGDLARMTGRASPVGEMVDGICDYASHVVLYLVLGWLLQKQIGTTAWGVAAAWLLTVAAGVSHVVQANHVEVQKRSYQWWAYGKPWMRQTRAAADKTTRSGAGGALVSLYMRVGERFGRSTARIDAAVDAAQGNPARLERIRSAARAQGLQTVLKWLGPNPRAIMLGISMLLGSPAWYFLWLVLGLNALLLASLRWHEAAAERLLGVIGEGGASGGLTPALQHS